MPWRASREQQGTSADDIHARCEHGAMRLAGGDGSVETAFFGVGRFGSGTGLLPVVSFARIFSMMWRIGSDTGLLSYLLWVFVHIVSYDTVYQGVWFSFLFISFDLRGFVVSFSCFCFFFVAFLALVSGYFFVFFCGGFPVLTISCIYCSGRDHRWTFGVYHDMLNIPMYRQISTFFFTNISMNRKILLTRYWATSDTFAEMG